MKRITQSSGFTLVELLVVVSIIALLLAILLPALGKAQAIARGVKCMSNERALNLAVNYYAGDNSDFLPPASVQTAFEGGIHVPQDYVTGNYANLRYFHPAILGQYSGNTDQGKGTPWSQITSRSLWRCPDDGLSSNGNSVSYSMIQNLSGNGNGQYFPEIRQPPGNQGPRWNSLPKLSQNQYPAMTMTFGEVWNLNSNTAWNVGGSWPTLDSWGSSRLYGNPGDSPAVDYVFDNNAPRKHRNYRMRHLPTGNGGIPIGMNMGFIDGHAQTIVSTPSNVDGEYWINDLIGVEFVFRPQDMR